MFGQWLGRHRSGSIAHAGSGYRRDDPGPCLNLSHQVIFRIGDVEIACGVEGNGFRFVQQGRGGRTGIPLPTRLPGPGDGADRTGLNGFQHLSPSPFFRLARTDILKNTVAHLFGADEGCPRRRNVSGSIPLAQHGLDGRFRSDPLLPPSRTNTAASSHPRQSCRWGWPRPFPQYPAHCREWVHTCRRDAPMLADGNIPIDPVNMAASSLKISPNRFVVRITSNCRGFRINCIAQLSTYMCRSSTS